MSTVLPRWPHLNHYVEDGKYFTCAIWSCKFTSLYAMHFTNWSLVLETIKDIMRIYFLTLFLSLCSNEIDSTTMEQPPAEDSASNVTKKNMQLASDLSGDKTIMKESHTASGIFCQRLYLFLLMLQFVAPIHIFITLFYIKTVKKYFPWIHLGKFPTKPLTCWFSHQSEALYVIGSCQDSWPRSY